MAVYFSIFLVVITIVTGVVWLADKFYLAPQRQLKLSNAQSQCDDELSEEVAAKLTEPSAFVDTSVQIFPVIAFVLILRSFLYEPFQIPSGSMMPTLLDGDFILVNKYNYGLRDPVFRNKFLDNGMPDRGDVVVFKYPVDPNVDYIKRVVGVPGDRVIYRDKSIYIKPACKQTDEKCPEYQQIIQTHEGESEYADAYNNLHQYASTMFGREHKILIDHNEMQRVDGRREILVPAGHFFVMGDNRDNSSDGRFWGFVPEENLVGEAVAIWMSFDFERDEESVLPTWVPTGIRFERLGGIQ